MSGDIKINDNDNEENDKKEFQVIKNLSYGRVKHTDYKESEDLMNIMKDINIERSLSPSFIREGEVCKFATRWKPLIKCGKDKENVLNPMVKYQEISLKRMYGESMEIKFERMDDENELTIDFNKIFIQEYNEEDKELFFKQITYDTDLYKGHPLVFTYVANVSEIVYKAKQFFDKYLKLTIQEKTGLYYIYLYFLFLCSLIYNIKNN